MNQYIDHKIYNTLYKNSKNTLNCVYCIITYLSGDGVGKRDFGRFEPPPITKIPINIIGR